jgi:pyridoxal phosphate enzyme (YggS family)
MAQLEDNLAAVRRMIAAACAEAGRAPDEVTLIAITKTFGESDIRALALLGVTDLGENREAELKVKAPATQDLAIRWHFVGQLQSNKAKSAARYADVVHSVDRESLVTALARAGRPLRCLVQVALSDDEGVIAPRGGVPPDGVLPLADLIAGTPGLQLGGVMAIAPLRADPDRAFEQLGGIAARLRAAHPQATWISAGMSDDLAAAIRHGATHVRVGRALLGERAAAG